MQQPGIAARGAVLGPLANQALGDEHCVQQAAGAPRMTTESISEGHPQKGQQQVTPGSPGLVGSCRCRHELPLCFHCGQVEPGQNVGATPWLFAMHEAAALQAIAIASYSPPAPELPRNMVAKSLYSPSGHRCRTASSGLQCWGRGRQLPTAVLSPAIVATVAAATAVASAKLRAGVRTGGHSLRSQRRMRLRDAPKRPAPALTPAMSGSCMSHW